MTDLYKDKYRIASARASWWDYGTDGAYYITICTRDRLPHFGNVVDGLINLSEIGEIAQQCWEEIPKHFPFVILDEYIVMPNHVHGIVVIDKGDTEDIDNVETLHATSLQNNDFMSRISPKSRSLPTIIRSFKSAVSKSARLINPDFAWQPRYHDRIIRDQAEHDRIANYIQDNPMNWEDDDLYL